MLNKIISIVLTFLLCLTFCSCNSNSASLNIFDDANYLIENASNLKEDDILYAYVDITLNEADEIISEMFNCTKKEARNKILKEGLKIYTYCNKNTISAMQKTYDEMGNRFDFGCALTNLNGNLVAAFSGSKNSTSNFAANKTQPHSAFKPLSVYAPAVENKIINWSSQYEDSPYKKLKDENGIERDWPSNASNSYYKKPILIYDAIKESLNTVAVKCLSDLGVGNSIKFLEENFDITLDYEKYHLSMSGDDEVIGNIALGSTQMGVSPVDMAGYYQIFANGGFYSSPKAIKKIVNKNGEAIYENNTEAKKVISSETAYIMQELLKGVVAPGGTGQDAFVKGIEIAGKTGTGDNNKDNWFVGTTPDFSCAVWHSEVGTVNIAASLFSGIVKELEVKNKSFATNNNVSKRIYCTESGKLFKAGCKKIDLGYYANNNLPEKCDLH